MLDVLAVLDFAVDRHRDGSAWDGERIRGAMVSILYAAALYTILPVLAIDVSVTPSLAKLCRLNSTVVRINSTQQPCR